MPSISRNMRLKRIQLASTKIIAKKPPLKSCLKRNWTSPDVSRPPLFDDNKFVFQCNNIYTCNFYYGLSESTNSTAKVSFCDARHGKCAMKVDVDIDGVKMEITEFHMRDSEIMMSFGKLDAVLSKSLERHVWSLVDRLIDFHEGRLQKERERTRRRRCMRFKDIWSEARTSRETFTDVDDLPKFPEDY